MTDNTFDTRYKSPAMRARHARVTGENPMEHPVAGERHEPEKSASGFLSADAFGGETPKEGATYTIRVESVDPDTREAEVVVVNEPKEETPPAETPKTQPTAESEMT